MQCSISIISTSEATRMSLIVRRKISCKKSITSPHNTRGNKMRIVQEKCIAFDRHVYLSSTVEETESSNKQHENYPKGVNKKVYCY